MKIIIPVLVTCGRFDVATPECMMFVQSKLKNSALVIFENSADMPHLEEREEYIKAIKAFISNNFKLVQFYKLYA